MLWVSAGKEISEEEGGLPLISSSTMLRRRPLWFAAFNYKYDPNVLLLGGVRLGSCGINKCIVCKDLATMRER